MVHDFFYFWHEIINKHFLSVTPHTAIQPCIYIVLRPLFFHEGHFGCQKSSDSDPKVPWSVQLTSCQKREHWFLYCAENQQMLWPGMNSNRLGWYTHIKSVCEKCAVGANLVQKQVMAGTPVRQKELVITCEGTHMGHQWDRKNWWSREYRVLYLYLQSLLFYTKCCNVISTYVAYLCYL